MGYAGRRLVNVHSKPAGICTFLVRKLGYAVGRLVIVHSKPAGIHVVLSGVRCRTFTKLGYVGGRSVSGVRWGTFGECLLKTCRNTVVVSSKVGVRCRTFGECLLKTCIFLQVLSGVR